VNCDQELCIELWSVINFHFEIEPAKLLQYLSSSYTPLFQCPVSQLYEFGGMTIILQSIIHDCL
jgi:hypothetical protein